MPEETRFRPPWWPEGEPFPPAGPNAWRGMRGHFARRVGLVVAAFFALMFLANALAWALFPGFGRPGHRGFAPLVGILGIGLLIALVAAGRAVRRFGRPVGEVMEAASRVAAGDYEGRVGEQGPREMRRLARSFNAMTKRLQANEEQRRNLLADVAHELRTPLSVIQGGAEGMLDGLYPIDRAHLEPLLEETRVMSRLLDDLQVLSTAEAGTLRDRKSTRLNSSHITISYAVFCLKKKKKKKRTKNNKKKKKNKKEKSKLKIHT